MDYPFGKGTYVEGEKVNSYKVDFFILVSSSRKSFPELIGR